MRKWFRVDGSHFGLTGIALGVFLLLIVLVLSATPAEAAPQPQGDQPTDEACLACHQQEGMTAQIGGEPVPLTIDPGAFGASVHGTGKCCLCGLPYEHHGVPASRSDCSQPA